MPPPLQLLALLLAFAVRGCVGWPPWADPLLYPDTLHKAVFISHLEQEIEVLPARYSFREAKQKCNARVVENVEYDFRPRSADMLNDPRNTVPYRSEVVREFYAFPDGLMFSSASVELVSGASEVSWTSGVLPSSSQDASNLTLALRISFSPPSRGQVAFRIVLELTNFLLSRSDYNVVQWRPFGPLWEGPAGAFVANATFSVTLPWGRSARGSHPLPDRLPHGKGFNIFTSLRKPLPEEEWLDDRVTIRFHYPLWISEGEGKDHPNVAGHAPLRVDLHFDSQQSRCNTYPYWIYLISFGAAAVFFCLAFSFIGFLYFEKPWRSLLQEDSLASRRRYLWKLREYRLEKL